MTEYFYGRVSSDEQRKSGLSVADQTARALALGIPAAHTFIDIAKSGGLHEDDVETTLQRDDRYYIIKIDFNARKEFRKLLSLLKPGDTVHYTKHDRLGRNSGFQDFFHLECEKRGITLHCLDESNDRLTRRILVIVAEEELLKTASRNQSIQASIYAAGGWPYRPPTGFFINKKENGVLKYPDKPANCLIIDPAAASAIQEVFRRMALGEPIEAISAATGVGVASIYTAVKNRVYLGETHLGEADWRPSPLVPALVTPEQFSAANARVTGKRYGPGERKETP